MLILKGRRLIPPEWAGTAYISDWVILSLSYRVLPLQFCYPPGKVSLLKLKRASFSGCSGISLAVGADFLCYWSLGRV